MKSPASQKAHDDWASRAFVGRSVKRPSERQIIAMERDRIDCELRQLREDFYKRQEARCSAA